MITTIAFRRELAKQFPHVLKNDIEGACKYYKTQNGIIKHLAKVNQDNERRHAEPIPTRIEIELTWRKSTYGNCPRATMSWEDSEGWHVKENCAYAGGWGYDKTSTIIAECLNMFFSLRWSLKNKKRSNAPYGVYFGQYRHGLWFDGGIGVDCYYTICKWMGYKMERVASTKKYDKFVITKVSGK